MNPGQQMTILGLAALCYYAVLLAAGVVGTDVMPQFVVSAVFFLSSGRLLRGVTRSRSKRNGEAEKPQKETNWELRAQILNWVMALLVICALGLWVMKPVGVSFLEMFGFK
jgi:Mn2+/Fe2+ NRAMP family transporter